MIECPLPVDIVLSPEWWAKNTEITFDRDFFFNPLKRVESEQRMEKELYLRWGKYGLGEYRNTPRPEIGAVHLAAGYLLSEMLGCKLIYSENHPPQVICANIEDYDINIDRTFKSQAFKSLDKMVSDLKQKYGYLTGDVNFGGVLNIAMDLFGQNVLMDLMMKPDEVKQSFGQIATTINRFTDYIYKNTGSTSISVNRVLRHLDKPVFLHSECSHTMISTEDYDDFLKIFDENWSLSRQPYGIHYCGTDPHRYAANFASISKLDFLDLGWGGDVKELRKYLPDTFFNIRLSPVEIIKQTNEEIAETIKRLVKDSGNPNLTGVCCINMDDKVTDDKIDTIFQTVLDIRNNNNNPF